MRQNLPSSVNASLIVLGNRLRQLNSPGNGLARILGLSDRYSHELGAQERKDCRYNRRPESDKLCGVSVLNLCTLATHPQTPDSTLDYTYFQDMA
jgi:hypothetical protein